MQHRRQPLPAYSGATTLRHDDDKHAKHLHARTRKLWFAAAVVGIVALVTGARGCCCRRWWRWRSPTDDDGPGAPAYVHPPTTGARRARGGSERGGAAPALAGLRPSPKRVRARAATRRAAAAAGRGAAAGARRRRGRGAAPSTARRRRRALMGRRGAGPWTCSWRASTRRARAARQAAIDAGGAARDAYRANGFATPCPPQKRPTPGGGR